MTGQIDLLVLLNLLLIIEWELDPFFDATMTVISVTSSSFLFKVGHARSNTV